LVAFIKENSMIAERLRRGERVVGTMLRLSRHAAILPLAKSAGLDFVMLDMEHGDYSMQTLADLALAGQFASFPVFVRVPELARGYVSRALDCGVTGVMVPMVETAEQAEQFVQWAKYPPLGGRGLSSMGGHTGYNKLNAVDAMPQFNKGTLAIAQIETATAIENITAIAAVPGIDVLLIGPNDLSVSLGHPGRTDTPDEMEAIRKVGEAAKQAGKIFGMHAGAGALAPWVSHGMRFFMNDIDTGLMLKALKAVNDETRKVWG
jgi:2-keto-3-deoxy-L-rhamnonate aldolase RhmA